MESGSALANQKPGSTSRVGKPTGRAAALSRTYPPKHLSQVQTEVSPGRARRSNAQLGFFAGIDPRGQAPSDAIEALVSVTVDGCLPSSLQHYVMPAVAAQMRSCSQLCTGFRLVIRRHRTWSGLRPQSLKQPRTQTLGLARMFL